MGFRAGRAISPVGSVFDLLLLIGSLYFPSLAHPCDAGPILAESVIPPPPVRRVLFSVVLLWELFRVVEWSGAYQKKSLLFFFRRKVCHTEVCL